MELKDTIELMISDNYMARFQAEYLQTKIRYEKLHRLLVKHDAGTLNFTPSCSIEFLRHQASTMGQYLYDLEVRAEIENIKLDNLLIPG